jgi:hypothetical protein
VVSKLANIHIREIPLVPKSGTSGVGTRLWRVFSDGARLTARRLLAAGGLTYVGFAACPRSLPRRDNHGICSGPELTKTRRLVDKDQAPAGHGRQLRPADQRTPAHGPEQADGRKA